MDEVELSLDASIPCGLIFNELISNALKYAFNGMKKGALNIGLREKNHQVTLYVKDNGVGLPKNIDVFNTDSLGLQLVSALTGQLDGKLDFKSEEGTNFIITFKNKLKIT
jgi:two-component sensor histidine kinase